MKSFWIVVSLGLIVLLAGFAIENAQVIQVSFWKWYIEASLAVIIISCLAWGALAGTVFNLPTFFSMRKKISMLKKEKEELEKQITTIKAQQYEMSAIKPTEPTKEVAA